MSQEQITARIRQSIMTTPSGEKEFLASDVSYQDVYAIANSLLEVLGESESAVFLCTWEKDLMAASVLAALAGGFSLILPYSYSDSVLREVQDTLSVRTAITDRPAELPGFLKPVQPKRGADSSFNHTLKVGPDQDFFYFFTGGSTDTPKMWPKTPRNLFSEAFYHSRKLKVSDKDLVLATVPPHHIYGFLFTVLVPFVSYASVVRKVCTFPEEIRNAMSQYSPTLFVSVPVHYKMFHSSPISSNSLRLALSSAGTLDRQEAECFHAQTHTQVLEIYGSTETGGIATRERTGGDSAFVPFEVLDWKIRHSQLLVRSPFIPPGIAKDAKGFFPTGDQVRPSGDNGFVLLGRADGVIKVGGKRINLNELQDKLKEIQGVEDAVVISIPQENGRENEICALLQSRMDIQDLREAASGVVEPYALPRRIQVVDKIPTSSAGKYDRKQVESILTGE